MGTFWIRQGVSLKTGCESESCSPLSTGKQISANNTVDARDAFAAVAARKALAA